MANSFISLLMRNRQTLNMNTHYRRLLQPVVFAKRNFTTEKPQETTEKPKETTEASAASEQQTVEKPAQDQVVNKEIEILKDEIKVLNEKNAELADKYIRSLADNQNLRSRLTKQIEDAKIFGIQGFCKDLIEVADILEIATVSVPKDELADKNPHLKNLYEGLIMTTKSLQNVFGRNGLEKINPLQEKFNPNFHEALFQKDDAETEPNIVIAVSKVGYKLRERCIRPALVGVSKSKQ